MSETIAPLELEKYLNDNKKLLILHALDGEIWGASIAATELLGYSNDEIKQMYLANIKPKTLRLADVCKTQKEQDAPVIFERRNGRRFAAKVETKIIRTTLLRTSVDLVLLQLSMVNTDNLNSPKSVEFNINETTDYINSLSQEVHTPVEHMKGLIKSLKQTQLTPEQKILVKNISRFQDDIEFVNQNITDSIKMGVNILKLERQPFNVVDMLGAYTSKWGKLIDNISIAIDRTVPELVYGDEHRLEKICNGLTRKSLKHFEPEQITLSVSQKEHEETKESIDFNLQIIGCQLGQEFENPEAKLAAITQLFEDFLNCSTVFVSKNLMRSMGGSLTIQQTSLDTIEISFWLELPEVHDLGLNGNRRFLQNHHVILLDETNSLLSQQLYMWGAMVEHFQSVGAAIEYASTKTELDKLIIIVNILDKQKFDAHELNVLLTIQAANMLLIKPPRLKMNTANNIMQIPAPYEPSMLGNMLSQFVSTSFPFPYSNSHRKRNETISHGSKRILIVDDNEDARELHKEVLENSSLNIDIAVNGIDAVLASAHNQYDAILMDIHLPYMDGFEAVTHIRKISELNNETPVIIISGDTSENAKLTMKQIGVNRMLEKPIENSLLISTMNEFIVDSDANKNDLVAAQEAAHNRRSQETSEDKGKKPAPINIEMIQRLEQDTTKDLCREMIDMFIEESLVTIGELENGCVAGDWQTVANRAHSLCSSSKTFGCEALHEVARKLEDESRRNNLGECMRLAGQLPQVFLVSQQGLYDICNSELK